MTVFQSVYELVNGKSIRIGSTSRIEAGRMGKAGATNTAVQGNGGGADRAERGGQAGQISSTGTAQKGVVAELAAQVTILWQQAGKQPDCHPVN